MKQKQEDYAPQFHAPELPFGNTQEVVLANHPPPQPMSMLEIVARASADPTCDVAKMQALINMKAQIDERDSETAFYRDMQAAQEEMRPVLRDRSNEHTRSRYATLEAIDRAIRPIYTKYGFGLTAGSAAAPEGYVRVVMDCTHKQGFRRTYELSLPVDAVGSQGKSNKTPVQAGASSVTYIRRILECMVFNIVTTDDADGNDPEPTGFVDDENLARIGKLYDILDEAAQQAFLRFMQVESTSQIWARDTNRALTALSAKIRTMQQKGK